MDTLKSDPDDAFAVLLAAYDTRLAIGDSSATPEQELPFHQVPDTVVERLQKARTCLQRLEQAWPRSQQNELDVPHTVGRFRIIGEVGRGGFGIVYLARDGKLGRSVALKVQRPEAIISPELRKRFINEGKITASLRHPNIAAVHEVGEAGFRIWVAAEYCDDGSLADWLQSADRGLSFRGIAAFLAKLSDAVEYAHQNGVLHRDLKPTNVLLQRKGSIDESVDGDSIDGDLANYEPKLIDFGLSKLMEGKSSDTGRGALLGTPGYMSPEQARGQLDRIGPATDVYGLGVLVYELLTSRAPFCGESDMATLRMVADGSLVRPSTLCRKVPRDLEAICLRCLRDEPQDRYPSAAALAADLRRFLNHQPTTARPLSPAQQLLGWIRRRPTLAGLIAASLAASLAFLALTAIYVVRLRAAHQTMHVALAEAQASAANLLQQERITNQFLYVSRMKLAFRSLDWGDVENAAELLAPYEAVGQLADFRSFEWHHLERRLFADGLVRQGHRGEAYAVAFSPWGDQFASGGQDGLIKFWNPLNGAELARISAHESCVNSVAFSPDGRLLASASCDHTIKLWEVSGGRLVSTLHGHPSAVECVAFAPNRGETLASCGNDPVVRIWNLATREVIKSLDTHQTAVRGLAWAPNGTTLSVAAVDSVAERSIACTWDIETGQVARYQGWQGNAAVVLPTSGAVCFGLTDATIRIIQPKPVQPVSLQGHHAKVESLAVSPDGRWLASGSSDATIRVWDLKTASCVTTLSGHRARVQSLAFDPSGARLASASFDGTVRIWNLTDLSQRVTDCDVQLGPALDVKEHVSLSSDLCFLAAHSQPDQVSIFRLSDGSVANTLRVADRPLQLAFLTGSAVLTGLPLQSPGILDAWDVVQQKSVHGFTARAAGARHFEISGDGNSLIAIGKNAVTIEDISTGRELAKIERPNNLSADHFSPYLSFSPDRNHVAISMEGDESTWIVDLKDPKARRQAMPRVRGISNRAEMILVDQGVGLLGLFDQRLGHRVATLRHALSVRDVAFSPDSKSLATICAGGATYLWNVATGERVTRMMDSEGFGVKVQFSDDGRKLAAVVALETDGSVTDGSVTDGSVTDGSVTDGSVTDEHRTVRVFVWNGLDFDPSNVERPDDSLSQPLSGS